MSCSETEALPETNPQVKHLQRHTVLLVDSPSKYACSIQYIDYIYPYIYIYISKYIYIYIYINM